jgi:hypothetical protein
MATSYEKCYDVFLSSTNDAEILYPANGETEEEYQKRIDTLLLDTLKKAVVKFFNPTTKLTRNDTTQMFDNDLRDVEVEIIGLLMIKEYYRKQLNFLASLKDSFSDKDWKSHDKANQMNQYRLLLKEIQDEIKQLTVANSYQTDNGDAEWWSSGE